MKILYLSSGATIHDEQFLNKFGTSRHEFCFASMHRHLRPMPEGIPYHYLGGDDRSIPGTAGRAFLAARMLSRLRTLVRRWRPDLIHAGPVNTAAPLAVALGFRPLLLMPWGSDVLVFPGKSLTTRLIVRHTLRQAALITCDARIVRDRIVQLASYPAEKIVIFPWGIDLERFQPRATDRERVRAELGLGGGPVIFMNRTFRPIYGVEYFLRALPSLLARWPDAVVVLAGDGPSKDALISLASDLGLSARIKFVGVVDNALMPGLLNAADVYVSSSLSDGTSISLLEAMACGLPVVLSDLPSNREWVDGGQNGLLVAPRDSQGLADAISRLLDDPSLRQAMGRRNVEITRERADWDRNYAQLEGMFDRIGPRARRGVLVGS